MSNRHAIPFLLLFVAAAGAGEIMHTPTGPLQEFRQRKTYPFVFEPVPYLENGAPPPLRFGEASVDCSRHNPPALPQEAIKQKVEPPAKVLPVQPKPEPTPAMPEAKNQPAPESSPAPASETKPVFPPPNNAQAGGSPDSLDMSKYPAEVVDYFKDPYNIPKSRKHFFDPVFEPAPTPKPQKSKATYREE